MGTVQGTFPQLALKKKQGAVGHRHVSGYWVSALAAVFLLLAAVVWTRPLWVMDALAQGKLTAAGMHSEAVTLDGHRIHYMVGGKGEPVLLVHGLGSRAADWADLVPSLVRSGHRVYAIDLLGYGESDRPQNSDYSIATESRIVEEFIVAENLQHIDLAGWSMGGWISMVVATDMPDRISKMVLLDSAGLRFQPSFDTRLFTPVNLQQLGSLVGLLAPLPHSVPEFVAKALLERSQSDAWVVQRSVDSMLTGQNLLDDKLSQLKMPVLIVWGKQDRVTPLALAYQLHAGVPNSTLEVYDGCGHLAPGLCADRIAPRMSSFLDSSGLQPLATQDVPAQASSGLLSLLFHH